MSKKLSKQEIQYQLRKPYTFRDLEDKLKALEKMYFSVFNEATKLKDAMQNIVNSHKES